MGGIGGSRAAGRMPGVLALAALGAACAADPAPQPQAAGPGGCTPLGEAYAEGLIASSAPARPFNLRAESLSGLEPRHGAPLQLAWCAARPAFVSLFAEVPNPAAARPGQPPTVLVRLFENRLVDPDIAGRFPAVGDPDIRMTFAGSNRFVLLASERPLHWLQPGDYADAGAFPRLRLSRAAFDQRLRTRLEAAPAAWEVVALETRVRRPAAAAGIGGLQHARAGDGPQGAASMVGEAR